MHRTGFHAQMYVDDEICKLTQDFTLSFSSTEIQTKDRGSDWIKYLKGLKDAPMDFDITQDDTDPTYLALKAAYYSTAEDNYLPIEFTNRPKTSASWKGFKADWIVTGFEESEPIDDEAITSVSIRLAANSPNEPAETGST